MASGNTKKTSAKKGTRAGSTGSKSRSSAKKASNSRSGSSSKKRSGNSQTKNTKNTSRAVAEYEEEGGLTGEELGSLRDAALILLFALCVLLFLSNFGIIGTVGSAVAAFLFGLFGSAAYVFPFILFVTVMRLAANSGGSAKGKAKAIVRAVMVWLSYICVAMFFALAWSADYESRKVSFKGDPFFVYGKEYRRGGGLIPGHLYEFMSGSLGQFGTVIIMIAILLICIGMITGKSVIKYLQESSREMAESAADSLAEGIEMTQEIRHERRARRRSHNVYPGRPHPTGDTISRLKLTDEEEESDEMREVTSDLTDETAHEEEQDVQSIHAEEPQVEEEIIPEPVVIPAKRTARKESKPAAVAPAISDTAQSSDSEMKEITPSGKRSVASSHIPDGMVLNNSEFEGYVLPSTALLTKGSKTKANYVKEQKETADKLAATLKSFGINVTMTDVSRGPTVTRYELQPEPGVKVSRILNLTDDIKLALAAENIRIEAPVPGKSAVGIEVPNTDATPVMLRDLLESPEFVNSKSKISFAVGMDIGGKSIVYDIGKMPHVLIAGSTGAGKSVCINTIIMSILYKADPREVKLIMIDPKVVELSIYNGIPHLMTPVVTNPEKAAGALNWSVMEMDKRYALFAEHAVRDLKGYNAKIAAEGGEVLPQIVIIVDELADLMMTAKNDVETAIVRLAQKARAAGMHLIIATQRPSVDVITGLIKANMPSRVAFTVTSGVDSRTILDMNGAEKLLGKGDMLFHPVGYPKPVRVQGAFVSDEEVEKVVNFVRDQKNDSNSKDVSEEIENAPVSSGSRGSSNAGGGSMAPTDGDGDEIFMQAAEFVVGLDKETASIGMLQRKFRLGFNRAARIMEQLSEEGIVGEEMGTKGRRIKMTPEQFEAYKEEHV